MNKNELISIIVPVYNSEKYLTSCLDSIKAQSYENLQIILVDDGSTDSSGKICDKFAKNDSRFIVIHQANSGQASARNKGLSIATGGWIGFVDNDDILDKEMYMVLYRNAIENNVLISGCATLMCYENGNVENKFKNIDSGVKNTKKIIEDIFLQNNHSWGAMWNKIYHHSLKDELLFPKGCQLEDYDVILKLYYNVKVVYFDNRPLYHWFLRSSSQSHKPFYDGKLSILEIADGLSVWFQNNCDDNDLIVRSYYFAYISRMSVLSLMWASKDKATRWRMKKYLPTIKESIHVIMLNKLYTLKNLKYLIKCLLWHIIIW